MVNTEIILIMFFAAKDGEALYNQQKQDAELYCGSDHELIAKFRLKLKKVGKTTWRRKWQPTPVFLPGESHGQRSLVGYSPRGCKEYNQSDFGVDHLVMSMYRVISCVVGRGCFL